MGINTKSNQQNLLYGIAFSMPFHIIISNILIGLLIINWVYEGNFKDKVRLLLNTKLFLFFFLFFLLHFLSLFFSDNLSYGLRVIEKRLFLFIFPIIIFSSTLTKEAFYKILFAFIAGCFLAMVYSLSTGIYLRWFLNKLDWLEKMNFFINMSHYFGMTHVYFGMYLVLVLVCLNYWLFFVKKDFKYLLLLILLFLFATGYLVLCGSFMSFTSLLIIFSLTPFFIPNNKVRIIFLVSYIFLAVAGTFFIKNYYPEKVTLIQQRFNISFSSINNDPYEYSSTRTAPILCSFEIIKNNWLLGVGVGDSKDEMTQCYNNHNLGLMHKFNSHNQYFGFLISFGFIGIIIYLGMLLYPLFFSLKHKDYFYLGFFIIICVCSLTENILDSNKGILFFTFFHCIFARKILPINS